MKAQGVILPLDILLSVIGAPIYIDRGRFFKYFSYFRLITLIPAAIYRCVTIKDDDILGKSPILLIISVIMFFMGKVVLALFINIKRKAIQALAEESMMCVPLRDKLRIRRVVLFNCIIVTLILSWAQIISILGFDYKNGNWLKIAQTQTLMLVSEGDWFSCSIMIFMVVLRGIKISERELILFSKTGLDSHHIAILTTHIEASNQQIKNLSRTLALLPIICFTYSFITTPGSVEYWYLDSIAKWISYEGVFDVYYIIMVVVLCCYSDYATRAMASTRETLLRAIVKSNVPLSNQTNYALMLLGDRRSLTITAYFFDLDCRLVLSFLGSLISFTVLFVQLNPKTFSRSS